MKKFRVKWNAQGYAGTFSASVVAETMDHAEQLWDKFVKENERIRRSWEKAVKAAKNHCGGYVRWTDEGGTDMPAGCYGEEFDPWNTGSDHRFD